MYLDNFYTPVFDMGNEPDYDGFVGQTGFAPDEIATNRHLAYSLRPRIPINNTGDQFAELNRMPNGILIRQQKTVRDPEYDFDIAARSGRSLIPQQTQYETPSTGIQRISPNMYTDSYEQPGNAEERMLNSQLGASLNRYLDSEKKINEAIDRVAAQYNRTPVVRRPVVRKQAQVNRRRIPNQHYDYARNIEGRYAPETTITAKRLPAKTRTTRPTWKPMPFQQNDYFPKPAARTKATNERKRIGLLTAIKNHVKERQQKYQKQVSPKKQKEALRKRAFSLNPLNWYW